MRTYYSFFMLCVIVFSGGCITAYNAPDRLHYNCEQFEEGLRTSNNLEYTEFTTQLESNQEFPLDIKNKTDFTTVFQSSSSEHIRPIILRYSDSGRLTNRCDYSRVFHAIGKNTNPKTIMVFIHGWHNDSGPKKNQLYNLYDESYPQDDESMGESLERFTDLINEVRHESERDVVGVFVSWKGGVDYLNDIPGLSALKYPISYISRRDTAERIGNAASLPRMLAGISNIADKQCTNPQTNKNCENENYVVFMGHSFGARILYKSIVDDYIINTQTSHSPYAEKRQYDIINGIADLTILINPAINASDYQGIDEFRYNDAQFADNQKPLIKIFQAENDIGNGIWYKFGQTLDLNLNFLQNDFSFVSQTVGFRPEFQTHRLVKSNCNDLLSKISKANYEFCNSNIFLEKVSGDRNSDSELVNISPYLVIKVDKDILDSHAWYSRKNGYVFQKWLIQNILTGQK